MSPIRIKRTSHSRRYAIALSVALIAVAALSYTLFQARFFLEGPILTLTPEPDIIQHERQITLFGLAENIIAITVNGRPIVTSETGVFTEPIVLENGYTIVRIEAQDRFGRTTAIERSFVYVPDSSVTLLDH